MNDLVRETREQNSPYAELLDGANLSNVKLVDRIFLENVALRGSLLNNAEFRNIDLSGANLQDADLSGADLRDADLSVADLRDADLSEANLQDADLSGADLRDANLTEASLRAGFSGADLRGADLSKADFSGRAVGANLSGADFRDAILSAADLRKANLSGTDLRAAVLVSVLLGNTDLSNVQLDHRTQFTSRSLRQRFKSIFLPRPRKVGVESNTWNAHARDFHKLAAICSREGLIGQARTLTILERHARRNETLSNGNILTALGAWLNWQATSYGISVGRVSRNMLLLFLVSSLTYLLNGIRTAEEAIRISELMSRPFLTESVVNTVYFSVVTFTTSPPWTVFVEVSQWMAMIETFLGTLLIVLLGYVLGHRDQI